MADPREETRERRGVPTPLRSLHPRASPPDWRWLAALDAWHPGAVAIFLGVLLAVVAALDTLSGTRFGVAVVYLIPVGLAAWRSGQVSGLLWAAVATATWLAVHLVTTRPELSVLVWNTGVNLVGFGAAAVGLAAFRRERDTVRALAGTDHLTGVLNAQSFHELVELERNRALRYNRPFTLAYMDVDGFRTVNVEWGHTAGDQALRLVATTIREHIRSMDSVSRMGGDEFALLFPETGKGSAEVAMQKVQNRLIAALTERSLELTFTMGGVICVGAPQSVDGLIQRAEALMYRAKEEGGAGIRTVVLDEHFGIEAILQRS